MRCRLCPSGQEKFLLPPFTVPQIGYIPLPELDFTPRRVFSRSRSFPFFSIRFAPPPLTTCLPGSTNRSLRALPCLTLTKGLFFLERLGPFQRSFFGMKEGSSIVDSWHYISLKRGSSLKVESPPPPLALFFSESSPLSPGTLIDGLLPIFFALLIPLHVG